MKDSGVHGGEYPRHDGLVITEWVSPPLPVPSVRHEVGRERPPVADLVTGRLCPMNIPVWGWFLTIGLMAVFLAVDVFVIARRPHVPSMAAAGRHLAFFVALAVLFGLFIWFEWGGQYAGEFYAGWLTEYSLSVDNLFVFLLIMASFKVPQQLQQSALMVGIIIAIVLRGIFIALGAVVINAYSWVFYLFGAFLVYTAVKLATEGESDDAEYHENRLLLWIEKRFPATKEWNGTRLTVIEGGKRLITPMLIVILALGTTDLLFALDSIPAIYGLTHEPFLVLTANIFALMGLRQLYFLIGGLLKKLVYLSIGLAVLLGFIGVKLFLHALHENNVPFINGGEPFDVPDIPITVSLSSIVVILGVTTIASLIKSGIDARREREAGIVPAAGVVAASESAQPLESAQ